MVLGMGYMEICVYTPKEISVFFRAAKRKKENEDLRFALGVSYIANARFYKKPIKAKDIMKQLGYDLNKNKTKREIDIERKHLKEVFKNG